MNDDWMNTGHLEPGDLRGVYEGRSSLAELLADKLGHARTKCRECELTMARAMAELHGILEDKSANTQLVRTLREAGQLGAERLKQWMADEADELLALEPEARRAALDAEEGKYRLPTLVDEFVERCEQQLTQDARNALELAELAVEISLRVDPAVFQSLAHHARARAEAHRANCLRLQDDAHAARDAFRHAHELYAGAAMPEPMVEAELQRLEASLAIDQRRFGEAEELLQGALAIYETLGASRALALTRLKQANLSYFRGETSRGLAYLRDAEACLDEHFDPKLQLNLRYSLVLYAVEAGQVEAAKDYFRQHRELLEAQPEPWFALRVVWLRAKLAHAEGKSTEAERLYTQAHKGFLEEGMGYDAALVGLELALLYLESDQGSAARRLATEMLPVFGAQDVHREALAALMVLQQAARAEELSQTLIRRLHRYLELARRDPTLRFADFEG